MLRRTGQNNPRWPAGKSEISGRRPQPRSRSPIHRRAEHPVRRPSQFSNYSRETPRRDSAQRFPDSTRRPRVAEHRDRGRPGSRPNTDWQPYRPASERTYPVYPTQRKRERSPYDRRQIRRDDRNFGDQDSFRSSRVPGGRSSDPRDRMNDRFVKGGASRFPRPREYPPAKPNRLSNGRSFQSSGSRVTYPRGGRNSLRK